MTAPDTALPPNKLAYSIEEACAAVSLGTTKLYELIGEGKISAKAEGRRTLIPRESLLSYIASLPAWTPKMRPAKPQLTGQSWDDMPLTQQAGIRCGDAAFQHWLGATDAKQAADHVRTYCAVGSRKHLVRGTQAGERWLHLERDFQAFLTSKQYEDYQR